MPREGRRAPSRGRRPVAPPVPVPDVDLQTAHAVARIEVDPNRPTGRMLFVDGIECSYIDLADPTHLEFSYVRRMADVVDLVRPAPAPIEAVHLGGGGCTLARYLAAARPRSRQVVYELDAGLVQLAREYLGLRTTPGLRVRVGDARQRLTERPDGSADIVFGDAFNGVVVPPQLATTEFVNDVKRVLRPGGVYVLNVIDCPPLRVSRTCAATLLSSFQHVALVVNRDLLRERDAGNAVFAASDVALPVAELARVAARGQFPDDVLDRAEVTRFAGTAHPLHDGERERWLSLAPPPDLSVPIAGDSPA